MRTCLFFYYHGMLSKYYSRIILLFLVAILGFTFPTIPVSGDNAEQLLTENVSSLSLSLDDFSRDLVNGNSNQIVGVYAAESFAYPIIQQPASNPGFVSTEEGKVTQFSQAARYGSIGLIAHNTLAGADFSLTEVGDIITLVYGDGTKQQYSVTMIKHFQALSPTSPYSKFVDLDDATPNVQDVVTVFNTIYSAKDRLVLQTCIAQDGVDSWGRLFVIAEPLENIRAAR